MKPLEVLSKMLDNILTYGLEAVGKYYSVYRGTVEDNNDPQGLGRLLIKVPFIASDTFPKWVVQENRYSGKGYGTWNIPEIGDIVFVVFERGNPNYPLWRYGYHAAPYGVHEVPEKLRSPKNHWYRTPKGLMVEFDEDSDEIRLTHHNGRQILVGKNISIIRKDGKIALGKLDKADEPAVLGDKNEKTLNDIQAILNDIATTLQTIAATDATLATSTYGLTYGATLNTQVPKWLTKINALTTSIKATKSTNVTLD